MKPKFDLYPAIDILHGQCVRLLKGDYDAKTEYADDPAEMAAKWIEQGARWLHVVDLNGAKSGHVENHEAITKIVRLASAASVSVQVGGGIRDLDTFARWMDLGVTRCVVGTAALDAQFISAALAEFGADALALGLDGRGGKLAVRGWLEQTELSLVDLAKSLFELGARFALVTDVDRDGTLAGANVQLAQTIQAQSGLQCLASGGIRDLDDVLAAKRAGLAGAIVGKSLYAGTLRVDEALQALEVSSSC